MYFNTADDRYAIMANGSGAMNKHLSVLLCGITYGQVLYMPPRPMTTCGGLENVYFVLYKVVTAGGMLIFLF